MIKATQQLSTSNDSLQNQVNSLQSQLNEMKAQIATLVSSGAGNSESQNRSQVVLSGAKLDQNVPNPFTKTTQINYYIPQSAGSAFIKVTGMNGETIKTIALNGTGSGQVTLQTPQLANGTYAYSLYIDGNLIDTKKMVSAK